MNWKRAILAALLVVPLVVILALGFKTDPHAVPSVLEGTPASDFKLFALDGKEWTLAGLHGKPAVLNFWATWCYPCQAEHELLQEAAQYYGDKVQFLGVVYQDKAEEVAHYLTRHANHYPQVMDPNSVTAIDFGVAGVPESFILNPNGQIVHKEAGVLNATLLRKFLDPMVKGSGG